MKSTHHRRKLNKVRVKHAIHFPGGNIDNLVC
jgi:hypothetical protein